MKKKKIQSEAFTIKGFLQLTLLTSKGDVGRRLSIQWIRARNGGLHGQHGAEQDVSFDGGVDERHEDAECQNQRQDDPEWNEYDVERIWNEDGCTDGKQDSRHEHQQQIEQSVEAQVLQSCLHDELGATQRFHPNGSV